MYILDLKESGSPSYTSHLKEPISTVRNTLALFHFIPLHILTVQMESWQQKIGCELVSRLWVSKIHSHLSSPSLGPFGGVYYIILLKEIKSLPLNEDSSALCMQTFKHITLSQYKKMNHCQLHPPMCFYQCSLCATLTSGFTAWVHQSEQRAASPCCRSRRHALRDSSASTSSP